MYLYHFIPDKEGIWNSQSTCKWIHGQIHMHDQYIQQHFQLRMEYQAEAE